MASDMDGSTGRTSVLRRLSFLYMNGRAPVLPLLSFIFQREANRYRDEQYLFIGDDRYRI